MTGVWGAVAERKGLGCGSKAPSPIRSPARRMAAPEEPAHRLGCTAEPSCDLGGMFPEAMALAPVSSLEGETQPWKQR